MKSANNLQDCSAKGLHEPVGKVYFKTRMRLKLKVDNAFYINYSVFHIFKFAYNFVLKS